MKKKKEMKGGSLDAIYHSELFWCQHEGLGRQGLMNAFTVGMSRHIFSTFLPLDDARFRL